MVLRVSAAGVSGALLAVLLGSCRALLDADGYTFAGGVAGSGGQGGGDSGAPGGSGGTDAGSGAAGAGTDGGLCPAGEKACGSGCVRVDDPSFGCSATGCEPCPALPNVASYACSAEGACGVAECTAGFGDCGDGAGCETLLRMSPNCGDCGAACGTGLVCGWSSMRCYDPAWIAWPMPNALTTYSPPGGSVTALRHVRSYDAATIAGVVIDEVTGLHWQRTVATGPGVYTWQAAQAYCAALSLDGTLSWRLPTRIELVSILDTRRIEPAIDISVFGADAPPEVFWTASPAAFGGAWTVDFRFGGTAVEGTDATTHQVRCVR